MFSERDFTVKQEQYQAMLQEAEHARLIKQLAKTNGSPAILRRLARLIQGNHDDGQRRGQPCLADEAAC